MKVARRGVSEKHREEGVKEIYEPVATLLNAHADECVVINNETPLMRRWFNRRVCVLKNNTPKVLYPQPSHSIKRYRDRGMSKLGAE